MARRNNRDRNFKRRNEPEHNVNSRIRAVEVRLVGNNFEKISKKYGQPVETGIYPTKQALAIAQAIEMDLVEISGKATPPVVKIVEYSKFLYEKKKREKEIKSKAQKTVIKEIRFGPNTDDHDFQFKLRHAEKFLEEGAKVKAFVQFRGRSIVFKERGELLLLRFIEALTHVGQPEALPKMEGRRMFVFVAPKKIPKKVVKSKEDSKKEKREAKKAAKLEGSGVENPVTETVVETPIENPVVETPKVLVVEKSVTETPKETIIEKPVAETVVETPIEKPAVETPKVLVVEKPVVETVVETPKTDVPKTEK